MDNIIKESVVLFKIISLINEMSMSNRPTAEVFNDHLELAQKNDIQTDINRNFSVHCVLMTSYGTFRDHQGVKDAADLLEKQIGRTTYKYHTKMVEGDIAFLEWSENEGLRIDDSYVFHLLGIDRNNIFIAFVSTFLRLTCHHKNTIPIDKIVFLSFPFYNSYFSCTV
jgi:hypothetical protein